MDDFKFLCVVVAIAISIFAVVGAGGNWFASKTCEAQAETMQLPHKFSVFTGCMMQDKTGKWWPISAIRQPLQR